MRYPIQLRAGLLAMLLCPLAALCEPGIKLAGFHAYLFNSRTGQFSPDILAKGAPELGNVPAGKFASVSTFVVVRVELGEGGKLPENLLVRLLAQETGAARFAAAPAKTRPRILLDKISKLGPVNDAGASYVGFWLDRTGCATVSLKASVVTPAKAEPLSGVLPFTCYE